MVRSAGAVDRGPLAENLAGAGFMVACMAGFASNDALMKLLAGEVPISQAVFVRGVIATALIGLLAWRQGALRFRPALRDGRLIGLRILGEIGGTVAFLTALFNMPIANASAILQSLPLAVTLAAATFFGEPVGWRRYLAIAIGFAGVLIIVRPGSDGFNVYALWALASVGFIVLRDLSTRRLAWHVPGISVAFITSAGLTAAAGLAGFVDDWVPLTLRQAVVLAAAGLCLIVGSVAGVTAMRRGEIGFVQPFRYTLLLFAMVYGLALFGEVPDVWTLTGSAIVVGTGLFTLHRERRAAK
jgi:drug/metabolite transporter (DMT)-like permease